MTGKIVSVVGTSGVGKSFLVRQLAAWHNAPAFLEGEEGTIPAEVLESVFSGENPIARHEWFNKRYHDLLTRARTIADNGTIVFTDGAAISIPAHYPLEEEQYHEELKALGARYHWQKSDVLVLLVARNEFIAKRITERARDSEQLDAALARALNLQQEFLRLAKKEKNVLVLDRTELEFTNEEDLQHIVTSIHSLKTSQRLFSRPQPLLSPRSCRAGSE